MIRAPSPNAAFALASFGEDIGAMMELVDRALALNPNYARGWSISGNLKLWAGEPNAAIERVEAALRLSPRARTGSSAQIMGLAHFYSRRFDEAVPKLLLAIQEDPAQPPPHTLEESGFVQIDIGPPVDTFGGAGGESKARLFEVFGYAFIARKPK